jgi:hypothetical protein
MKLRHGWSASLIGWDCTRNGRSPDERSLRRTEKVQRRVRQKSLYLSDSSDRNHTPDQVRQSIAHVLDEWADSTAMSASVRTDWLSRSDRIGDDLHHAHDDCWSGPQRRRNTCAREPAGIPPMQKTNDSCIGWARCRKWRNSLGLADEMQAGFLHRVDSIAQGS